MDHSSEKDSDQIISDVSMGMVEFVQLAQKTFAHEKTKNVSRRTLSFAQYASLSLRSDDFGFILKIPQFPSSALTIQILWTSQTAHNQIPYLCCRDCLHSYYMCMYLLTDHSILAVSAYSYNT